MRRLLCLSLVALGAVGLGACGGDGESGASTPDGEVVIGGIHPVTGPASYYGIPMNHAIELAVDEINAAGGVKVGSRTQRLKYQSEDDKTDPTAGVAALKKLTSNGVQYVVGPVSGAVASAVVPIIEGTDTQLIVDGAATTGLAEAPNVFRLPIGNDEVDEGLLSLVEQQGFKTVSILNDQANPSFANSIDSITKGLKADGAQILAVEQFSTGDSDFRAQLTDMLGGRQPDALIARGYAAESAQIAEQAKELGFKGRVVWQVLAPAETVKDLVAEEALDGVLNTVYATPELYAKLGNERIDEFIAAYKEKFGEPPGALSAFSYDAIYTLAAAFEAAGSTETDAVADALQQLTVEDLGLVNDFEPQDGSKLFDDVGQAHVPSVPAVWRNGDWKPIGR